MVGINRYVIELNKTITFYVIISIIKIKVSKIVLISVRFFKM